MHELKNTAAGPTVSVLVSYYNDREFLAEHITSVLNQSYPHWELVLVNHASTDDSREIARSFTDPRIKHIDYPVNLGAMGGVLLKEALKHSSGKYVKFFSADDCLTPTALETLVRCLEQHPEADFAFADAEYVDQRSRPLGNSWFKSRRGFSLELTPQTALKQFFEGNSIFPFAGQIIRRSALKEEYLSNNFILFFDIQLWVSLLLNGHTFALLDVPAAHYRIHGNQATSVSKKKILYKRASFESEAFRRIWFARADIPTVRFLCADSPYAAHMQTDTDRIFVLAEYLLRKQKSVTAYMALSDLLDHPQTLEYIRQKFNFTVYDLRTLCAPLNNAQTNMRKEARETGADLSLPQLAYLAGYRVQQFFSRLKKKHKKEQEYSA